MEILHMSLAGSLLIIATAALRALAGRRLPKWTFLPLWGAALFRLLAPASIPSPVSVYNLLRRAQADGLVRTEAGYTACAFPALWLGTAALALFFLLAYLRHRRRFAASLPTTNAFIPVWLSRRALRRRVAVRVSDRTDAPLTYGILRPVILLPRAAEALDEAALGCILTHELVHIRRFDALWKLLLTGALCVHWFNPLVWLMCALANRDLELSCDERVVKILGTGERAFYAKLLIGMEEHRMGTPLFCSSFCKNAIEERIYAIMNMKKMTAASMALALGLIAGTLSVFATESQPVSATMKSVTYSVGTTEDAGNGDLIFSVIGEDGKTIPIDSKELKVDASRYTVTKNGDNTYTIREKNAQGQQGAASAKGTASAKAASTVTFTGSKLP